MKTTHLTKLKIQLPVYFSSDNDDFSRIDGFINPFYEKLVAVPKLSVDIHNLFGELSADRILQLQFLSQDLSTIGSLDEMNTLVV